MKIQLKLFIFCSLFGAAASAFAQAPITESIDLMYYSNWDGPSLFTPSRYIPLESGAPNYDDPVLISHFLVGGYRITDSVTLGGVLKLDYHPFIDRPFVMKDPGLRIATQQKISENFTLFVDFRLLLPLTQESKENRLLFGNQSFQNISYRFGSFIFNSSSEVRYNFHEPDGSGHSLTLGLTPSLYYEITESLYPFIMMQTQYRHYLDSDEPAFLTQQFFQFGPGLSWSITENLSVEPSLLFPVTHPVLRAAAISGYLQAKLF